MELIYYLKVNKIENFNFQNLNIILKKYEKSASDLSILLECNPVVIPDIDNENSYIIFINDGIDPKRIDGNEYTIIHRPSDI